MVPYLVVAMQAAAVAGPPLDVPLVLRAVAPCTSDAADPDAIVVCGRRDEPYRLRALPPRGEQPAIPKAETTLFGGVKGTAEVEQAGVGGFPSNRVMLRLKMPF